MEALESSSSDNAAANRLAAWVAGAAIVIGIVLRLVLFLQQRSLWLDESMMALAMGSISTSHFAAPLVLEQMASPLFVLVERLSISTLGMNELALRLVPLVAGCIVLPLIWFVGRQLCGAPAASIATCTAALAPDFIKFSAEMKPYTIDAVLSLMLFALLILVVRQPKSDRNWVMLLIAGLLALGFSVPSIFTLCVIGIALLVCAGHERRLLGRIIGMGVVWCAMFGVVYALTLSAPETHAYMQRYWTMAFVSSQESLRQAASFVSDAVVLPVTSVRNLLHAAVIAGLIAVGAIACVRRGIWVPVILAGPFVLAVIASAIHAYPLGGRTGLFYTPSLFLLFGSGIVALVKRLPGTLQFGVAIVLTFLLTGGSVRQGFAMVFDKLPQHEASRDVIKQVIRRAKAGEPIYVFIRGMPNWLYYTTDWSQPDTARLNGRIRTITALGPNSGNASGRRHSVGANEGKELRFPFHSGVELIGIPTGVESRAVLPPFSMVPDSGWADHEAQRMHDAFMPSGWLMLSHYQVPIANTLLQAVCKSGGQLVQEALRNGAVAYHVTYNRSSGEPVEMEKCPQVSQKIIKG